MANSGYVRITTPPPGVGVFVGTNSGNVVGTPVQASLAGGGNVFLAWVKSVDVDTIIYVLNHSGSDVALPFKWNASDGSPGNNTTVNVPKNQMVQVPASAASGL